MSTVKTTTSSITHAENKECTPEPFPDWIGFRTSALNDDGDSDMFNLERISIASFDQNVDDAFTFMDTPEYANSLSSGIDWSSVFNPFTPSCSLFDSPSSPSEGSSLGTSFDSLSLISDVNSSDNPISGSLDFSDELDGSVGSLDPYSFTFQYDPLHTVNIPRSPTPPFSLGLCDGDFEHAAGAPSPLGVEVTVELLPLTPTTLSDDDRVSPLLARKAGARADEDECEKHSTKKRRRQDITPKHECGQCGAKFARTHNLKVHVADTHEGRRSFKCTESDCTKQFARKHDLVRHHQSKHTELGSPRRKAKDKAKSKKH